MKLVENKMTQAVQYFEKELNSLRTSRANPSMLNNINVEAYGNKTPMINWEIYLFLTSTLTIQVWDQSLVKVLKMQYSRQILD